MNKLRSTVIFLILMIGISSAQVAGKISGTVMGSDGQVLPGANVVIQNTSMGSAADVDGKYVILNVPVGNYSVTATYIGYSATTVSGVAVKGGLTSGLDFSLEVSAIEGQEITITKERRLIEPSATNSVRIVGTEEIQNSASRSVTDLLDLQPGVVITNGDLHIRGGREEEVAYTLDGADIKDPIFSGRLVTAIPEALSEIAVEAGGYGAHIGGANSGVVRQTFRTSGNKLEANFRVEGGDFGYNDKTIVVGSPVGPVSLFVAYRQQHDDDWDPTFYQSFKIDLDEDGIADLLPSYESGITADGDSIRINFNPKAGEGIKSRESDLSSFNGSLAFRAGPFNLQLSGVLDNLKYTTNATPIYTMFNNDRLTEVSRKQSLMTARLNYFVSPKLLLTVGVNTLNRHRETYDKAFGEPDDLWDVLLTGDSSNVATVMGEEEGSNWRSRYLSPSDYYVGLFPFRRPGDIMYGWGRRDRKSFGFDAEALLQKGSHEIRVGFESKTFEYRNYYFGTSAIYNMNVQIENGALTEADIKNQTDAAVEKASAFNRLGNIGYDDWGNEVNGDFLGARKPHSTSFYVNDKYEEGDIVVNLGVRVDNYNLDDWRMKDENNPGYDATNQGILEDEFKKSETKSILQPRLGLAFPVSDKAVFRLQYGKYAQMPQLDEPYAPPRYMHLVWGGQNYTPSPMGFDLDPIITTQYELGFSYQFLKDVALDVSAYAKNTTGQIVITKNRTIESDNTYGVDVDALYYSNGDFTTVNGMEFVLSTRRISRLQTVVTYSWSDTRGVSTEPNSAAGNLVQEALAAPPAMIMPLYYQNRHRGSVVLDYRFGENDGGMLFSDFGFNLQYKFNSGHPFTLSDGGLGQRSSDSGALLDDARAREPQEPIGQSQTPWNYLLNLKVEKGFRVGGVKLKAFMYVENLMDTKNVINVYSRSGNAYEDGYLTDPSLSAGITAAQGQLYTDLYRNINLGNRQHFMNDFAQDVFGLPRVTKFGISVDL